MLSQLKIRVCLTSLSYNFGDLQQFAQATYAYAYFIYKFIANYYKLPQVAANCDLSQLSQLSRPRFSFATTRLKKNFLMYNVTL